jgi:hypothetical protein
VSVQTCAQLHHFKLTFCNETREEISRCLKSGERSVPSDPKARPVSDIISYDAADVANHFSHPKSVAFA